ncbi:hypothetical protein PTSG_06582 [Salpingoeca rosetta]|uniref:SUMO-activating enzyme subunit n=1 Tax=Salpingoeca rosetta (strain ATCC 50818 / BSB-021) TaxID=946362 RepID=F2UG83_SALR5|nr:uncharacterized protein PTSG_06582 [Salpingoeca rosetta]EGD75511.1 hypothetical protein PTSG_06582 [Salpingoeca rosetta]|eukprot:XP_004991968.1 hypothetical protein PTSG_06582 [Salpingoeca rosetta]
MTDRTGAAQRVLGGDLYTRIKQCKLLVVGAGGIGCELLKNVALAGFQDIHVIDLDTIELTNLNRQFLFQQQHVGQSKAKVARESVLRFNPSLSITAHHANIFEDKFSLGFFEQFDLVMNALDNLKARNHVNRMCLAANKPLIESGSAGYLGQVTVISKGKTECYECQPKPPPKQYPACTIRNTPSTIVHCIVWAKFLFSHLYGEADHENDVAPNPDDPELSADAKDSNTAMDEKQDGEEKRMNTRQWAESNDYDPQKLLEKLFVRDVIVLLSLASLWKKRAKPRVLDLSQINTAQDTHAKQEDVLPDQKLWTVQDCVDRFLHSAGELKKRFQACAPGDYLTWDKDDDVAMDFVCAAANLRAYVFGIPLKSRFDIKSMAGNIIPAIATTNAVVAGLILTEAMKVLRGDIDSCKAVYLSRTAMGAGRRVVNPVPISAPNPKCYVCGERAQVTVRLDPSRVTVETLAEQLLKKDLSLVAPVVVLASGAEMIAAPEDEEEEHILKTKVYPRTLASFGIRDGTACSVMDDMQANFKLSLVFRQADEHDPDTPYEIVADTSTAANNDGNGVGDGDEGDEAERGASSAAAEKRKHSPSPPPPTTTTTTTTQDVGDGTTTTTSDALADKTPAKKSKA